MKGFYFLSAIFFITLFADCKKETTTVVGIAEVEVNYSVDGDSLLFDRISYLNEAGNNYSVSRLEYYLTDITFLNGDEVIFQSPEIIYVNARSASTNFFNLANIPLGDYDCIELTIGLSPENNISNALPNTIENNNMFWPDVMGGGYHFLKLEGHYLDSLGNTTGYALHQGSNDNAIRVKLNGLQFQVRESAPVNMNLKMNINEWYRNPATYDFNVDGNYSMGNMTLMQKIADNGKDVFTLMIDYL